MSLPLHLHAARRAGGVRPAARRRGPGLGLAHRAAGLDHLHRQRDVGGLRDRVACPTGARVQGPLIAFEIAGPLDFSTVGVLSGLLEPLAKQGISILALSTYDTDWILIGAEHADEAMATWKRDGNTAAPARLSGGPS